MAAEKASELRRLVNRFDANAVQYFQGAMSLCASRTHYEVTPEHMLMRLLDEPTGDVAAIFNTFRVDRAQIRRALGRILEELPANHSGKPVLSPKLIELFQSAEVMSDELGFPNIRTGHLILAYVLNPNHTRLGEFTSELQRIDVDQLRDHFQEIVLGAQAGAEGAAQAGAGPGAAGGEGGALEQFTVDLTAKAAAGHIDPVFGRDEEIRQMIDIFARRRKNNPILVGEPGTGKTAIVEGLALRIVEGDVPPMLKGVKLILLDLGLLQAGAGVKGEFENRLKNVINAIKASQTPIITFIDEAHVLIGAGASAGGSDAANLLKPALARGELRTVAATTWAEYKKYFEKDAALARRFQLVQCNEPTVDATVVMLRGLKDKYENHHKLIVLDEAVQAASELSSRYISGRFLPDKAVDLLDTSCARVTVSLTTRPGELEDHDRELGHLDTAVLAVNRDQASGIATKEGLLDELEARRGEILKQREAIEQKWQKELELVHRIHELRASLKAYQGKSNAPTEKREEGAKEAAEEATTAKQETPQEDEAEIRRKIDEATGELKKVQGDTPLVSPHVDAATVASVVSDWTGIPVGRMVRDQISATLEMESRLRERVVGQDHALKIIAQKLRTAKSGLNNPDQPMGVFLCVGPSGVGKTELALSVADLLFGGDQFLTSINMSEFMEAHTVSLLKGSPPGYVGYGEGGVLTEAVRQHPYSVVLLDEVEKAHPDVMNLFYQVFDKGSLADGEGRVINFRNTVIILTSNLGTDVIQSMCESGEEVDFDALKEGIYPHLRNHFKPALVARMTVIPFFTLSQEILKQIAQMKLRKVGKRLAAAHGMNFKVDDAVYTRIAESCTQVDIGARQIDHALDQMVLPDLSRRLLERMADAEMPKTVTMGVGADGEFTYEFSG